MELNTSMNSDPNQPYNFDYFFAKNLEENATETDSDDEEEDN